MEIPAYKAPRTWPWWLGFGLLYGVLVWGLWGEWRRLDAAWVARATARMAEGGSR